MWKWSLESIFQGSENICYTAVKNYQYQLIDDERLAIPELAHKSTSMLIYDDCNRTARHQNVF